jgi:hypothetical protein
LALPQIVFSGAQAWTLRRAERIEILLGDTWTRQSAHILTRSSRRLESLYIQCASSRVIKQEDAVHRTYEDGAVRETFRTLGRREGAKLAGVFSFLESKAKTSQANTWF